MKRSLGTMAASRLARDTMWSLATELIALVTALTSFLLLGRTLGTVGYGAFAALFGLIAPFATFSNSGTMLATMDHLVRTDEPPRQVLRSIMAIAQLFGVLAFGVVSALALALVPNIDAVSVVVFVAGELLVIPLFAATTASIQALHSFRAATIARSMNAIVKLCVLTVLMLADRLTLASFAVWQTTGTMLLSIGFARWIASRSDVSFVPGSPRRVHARSMALYSVGVASFSVQNDSDKVVLANSAHAADAGLYAAAYRIVSLGTLPINALVNSSHISALEVDDCPGSHLRKMARLSAVSAAYAVALTIVVWICAPVLPMLLGDDFAGTVDVLRWLAPLVILRASGPFPMNGLMGLGRNTLRTVLLVLNAALSVALYVALIPDHSWQGAVAATMISEVVLLASAWSALLWAQRVQDRRPRPVAVPDIEGTDMNTDRALVTNGNSEETR